MSSRVKGINMTDKITCPHCGLEFDYDWLNDEKTKAVKAAISYSDMCHRKFQAEHHCPRCGSHNVDIDWETEMYCNDCGWNKP
jgi:hypothetical protein